MLVSRGGMECKSGYTINTLHVPIPPSYASLSYVLSQTASGPKKVLRRIRASNGGNGGTDGRSSRALKWMTDSTCTILAGPRASPKASSCPTESSCYMH